MPSKVLGGFGVFVRSMNALSALIIPSTLICKAARLWILHFDSLCIFEKLT
jgi:hypothetical protein